MTQKTEAPRILWRKVCANNDNGADAKSGAITDADADASSKSRVKRAARHIYATTWPGALIPFQFEWGMQAWQKHMVRNVMTIWERSTCVRFREWPMAYDR